MASTVVKGALKAIREKGFGTFLRELREEGYTSVSLSSSLSLSLFFFPKKKSILFIFDYAIPN